MNWKKLLASLSMAFLLALTIQGYAQTPSGTYQSSPVVISHTLDSVLGKAYFVHTVQKGHTLYSICKAYKVEADQILKDSPGNEVQLGEFLYIPFKESLVTGMGGFETFQGKRPWAVVFYERDHQGEASYATGMGDANEQKTTRSQNRAQARKERRKQKALARAGKETQDTVAVSDSVLVANEADSLQTDFPIEEERVSHLRRKASQDRLQISLLLPLYSNRPESRRAYIYLPFFEGASVAWLQHSDSTFFLNQDTSLVSKVALPDSSLFPVPDFPQRPGNRMKEQNSANPSPGTATPSPLYKPHKKARKTELELKLYDIAETYSSLEKTLHDPFFLSSDLIVAGAFVHQFPALDSFSRRHEIPLLHPFSERDSMAVGNPWFMQTSAPTLFQIQEVAGFVKANFAQACKIVISDSSIQEIAKAKSLQEMIPGSKRWLFNEITEILLKDLPTDTPVVIIPFYQEEITAVKTFLPLRQGKGNITLIAPATWLEYSTTDVDYFLQNNLTVYSTFVTDKDTPEFKDFARKYYLLYNSIPSSLAYQGYRIFSWLLPMLEEHNADFMRHIEDGENPFHLQERPGLKGFESQNIRFFKLTETGFEALPLTPAPAWEME